MQLAAHFLLFSIVSAPLLQSDQIGVDASTLSGSDGWACEAGYVARGETCVRVSEASDKEIRQHLVLQSIASYSGNCPCPFNVDRAGRRCGGRSAYSRPGGASPLCYEQDVTDAQVLRLRERYPDLRSPGSTARVSRIDVAHE